MAEWQIIKPATPQHWEEYYRLRYERLRKPWGEQPGSEKDPDDGTAIHGMILDSSGKALAVGRIHQNAPEQAQIRYMAVKEGLERRGLGKAILTYIEKMGKKEFPGIRSIMLQAREEALGFYRANGYALQEKTFVLFDQVQHYRMQKKLDELNPSA